MKHNTAINIIQLLIIINSWKISTKVKTKKYYYYYYSIISTILTSIVVITHFMLRLLGKNLKIAIANKILSILELIKILHKLQ